MFSTLSVSFGKFSVYKSNKQFETCNNIVSPPTLTENGGFFSSYYVLNSGKNKMRAIGILGKFSQIKQEFYNYDFTSKLFEVYKYWT